MRQITNYTSLLLFILLLLNISSAAQKIKIGIKAGYTSSSAKVTYTDAANTPSESSLGGFTGGFFLHVPLSKQLTFRPELYYSGKGTKEKYTYLDAHYISKTRVDYFELPLNLLYTHSYPKGSFYIGGGPFIALLSTTQYGFYSTSYKNTDGGINLLTSFEIPIGFSFNINYSYSLANISDNSTTIKTWKNRSLGINVGYRF